MNTSRRRSRVSKNQFTTRSGNTFKIHRSLSDKLKNRKDGKALRKAERLSGLPKGRFKRFVYRMHPKRLAAYWFSRDGGIMALKVLGIGFISGFLILIGLFAYFRKDLPNLRDISGNDMGGSIRYYDRTGQTLLWEDYDAVKRIPVKDEEISQFVKDATIAIEDKDFFKHSGFDLRGIARAGINNALGKSSTQGGSTLTQQLVKVTQNWTQDHSYARKVKEIILAVELERTYSKKEILTGYLNSAPYGGVEYGVEAAARDYFNKSAKDLTLEEAALLAAIPKSPTYLSPYSNDFDKEFFIGRQHYILDLMQQQGMISTEQRDTAKKVDVLATVKPRKPKYEGITAPYFVLTVKESLEEKYGATNVKRGGWKVTTTLDTNLQKIAEEQVNNGMAQVRRQGGDTAAFAASDVKTGQMVALVGGVDFSNKEYGENNYARLRLPPGSSFKPYDYAALIEHTTNSGAGSVLYDTLGPLEGYPCTNRARPPAGNCLFDYDFRTPGPMTIRYALGGSRNIPAVKAMLAVGVEKTIQTAEKMGLKSGYNCYSDDDLTKETACYGSSAIGDGAYLRLDEHVHAYGTLSRNGLLIPQTYILKIEDAAGKKVDEWKPSKGEQVIRAETAYIIDDILSDPRASYLASKPHNYKGWKFGFKTGTTNDSKDGWMMGMSPQYTAGVWVGYHNRQRQLSGFMENMTQPIVAGFMQRAHDNLKVEERPRPGGIKVLPAYVVRTHVGVGSVEPSPTTDLFPSWYQNTRQQTGEKKTLDVVSNKLATDCTPPRARKESTDTAADSFSSDPFTGANGSAANTTEKDDVHKCEDAKPTISLSITGAAGGPYTLTAIVNQGTHPLSSDKFKGTVSFAVNGQTLPGGSFEIGAPGSVSYQNYSGSGSVTATIVDSVLYDATDTRTIEVAGITLAAVGGSGNNASFNWSGGSGPYTVTITKNGGGSTSCSSSGTSCSATLMGSGSYQAYVTGGGVQSNTISFNR